MFGGKIRGAYHFYMMRAIIDIIGADKFPRYSRILKITADLINQWYGWEGLCEFLNKVAKMTSEAKLRSIGVKCMRDLKEGFISAGFTSADTVLRDYDPHLKKNTKQMLPEEIPKTIQHERFIYFGTIIIINTSASC